MVQIGKDYYEDLTVEKLSALLDALAAGQLPVPGPQNGRFSSEPSGGPVALRDTQGGEDNNASVALALKQRDTVKRIDGSEAPILTPWRRQPDADEGNGDENEPEPSRGRPADETGVTVQEAAGTSAARPRSKREPAGAPADAKDTE
jgi:NADH-quinone oxidoreductase subunit E